MYVNYSIPLECLEKLLLQISLDPPIKQGQTRYHYLVLLFNQDDTVSMDLPFDE